MSDFWVFGYGSLMWRPGFDYEEAVPAVLNGARRSLCVYSWVHRGTREKPGLVLGLDRGGSCRGVAFRVKGARKDAVVAYLRERELVTLVYRETWRPVRLVPDRRPVRALTFLVDRSHEQYAGVLPPEELLRFVTGSHGRSGDNEGYVISTADHLASLGIRDATLEWLASRLRR
jgi:cation transport protein ChaC